MNVAETANSYLGRGWSVLPVGPDKRPLIAWRPLQSRRAEPAEIRAWLRKWPRAGIGVVTGAVSGLLVLDADGAVGVEEAERMGLPTAPAVKTPRGRHYYFAHPGGRVRNGAKLGASRSLDVRADGGYVVAPPSASVQGVSYEWITEGTPPPMPAVVSRLVTFEAAGAATARETRLAREFHLTEKIRGLIDHGYGSPFAAAYPSRSEVDQAVIGALARAGAGLDDVYGIFCASAVGGKMREISGDAGRRRYIELGWRKTQRAERAIVRFAVLAPARGGGLCVRLVLERPDGKPKAMEVPMGSVEYGRLAALVGTDGTARSAARMAQLLIGRELSS